MIAYIDTSAAAKLLKDEAESPALQRYLNVLASQNVEVTSSALLETELRRLAERQGVAQSTAAAILDRLDIFDLVRSMFVEAGILPYASLRSLDALHVVAALRIGADTIISYDRRMAEAAESLGLRVESPS